MVSPLGFSSASFAFGPFGLPSHSLGSFDGIEPRAAAAVDLGLLVHVFHARHHVIHLLGQPIHGLLCGVKAPELTSPMFCHQSCASLG